MTYKLINKKTQEEHICSKVVIDGFDYYVNSDSYVKNDYTLDVLDNNLIEKVEVASGDCCSYEFKIIATNNPNIDLPQVIDEVMLMAENRYGTEIESHRGSNPFDQQKDRKNGFITGYNKSQETHSFSEDDMVEFVTWVKSYKFLNGTKQESDYSKKELLELWKEQQSEIIYFN